MATSVTLPGSVPRRRTSPKGQRIERRMNFAGNGRICYRSWILLLLRRAIDRNPMINPVRIDSIGNPGTASSGNAC